MGYANVEVFTGKTHDDNDIYAGFRFVVDVAQGTTLTMAKLHVYLERMYPASTDQDALDRFTDINGTDLEVHTMDVGPAGGWVFNQKTAGEMTIQDNYAYLSWRKYYEKSIYVCNVGTDDGTLYLTTTIHDDPPHHVGIVFRFKDLDNFWSLRQSGTSVTLYKTRDGLQQMGFESGSTEFTVGETLTGDLLGNTAEVVSYSVSSGTWGGGDAAGTVHLTNVTGNFRFDGEELDGSVGGNNMAENTGPNTNQFAIASISVPLNRGVLKVEMNGGDITCTSQGQTMTANESATWFDLSGNVEHGLVVWGTSSAVKDIYLNNFEFIPSGTPNPLLWARCDDVDDSEPFCEKMDFDSGSVEFTVTETLTGDSSGATGVVNGYTVTGGTWGGGNAAGTVYLTSVSGGPFTNDEALNGSVGGDDMATADGINSTNLPDGRVLTTNTQSLGDMSGWSEGAWNITTDIKLPVQEVLDRPGWVSGNHLSVILMPQPTEDAGSKMRVTSYEGSASLAAKLFLYY